ncbi:hypothetical protein C8R42DRAFT_724406 [Lentinula raphanica]|nr:hypothetical protein C8R42DRAFT_724406 [Lentinula raphanica]
MTNQVPSPGSEAPPATSTTNQVLPPVAMLPTSLGAGSTNRVLSPALEISPVAPTSIAMTNQVPSPGSEAPPATSTTNQTLPPVAMSPTSLGAGMPMSLGAGGTNRVPSPALEVPPVVPTSMTNH